MIQRRLIEGCSSRRGRAGYAILSTSTRADTLPAKIVLMGCLVDPIDVIRWSVSGALGGIVHAVFVHVEPRN